jgi:ACR3 family arsenite efflux pump ArsB
MLVTGFIAGLYLDTSILEGFILPVTVFIMIYPTMIGFKINEIINTSHTRLLWVASVINFILIPLLAYVLGVVFLMREPQLFAGLAIASLLPTSNMTIAFTHFGRGIFRPRLSSRYKPGFWFAAGALVPLYYGRRLY